MRVGRFVTVAVLTAGLVVLAAQSEGLLAQQKGKGKGQGFGGGFGNTIDVTARVLDNKALQEELKLTSEQKDKLKPVADKQAEFAKKQGQGFGGGKGGKGGFDKEKFAEAQKERQAMQEEVKKAVNEALTEAQKMRVKQIEVQAAGPAAFTTEENVKGLNLTDTQKTKIKEVSEEFTKESREARRELFGGGGGGFDPAKAAEVNQKVDKLSTAAVTKIVEALNEDQKKTWKTVVGEPFDVSKLRPQFRKID
jgi:hypothetical protein